MIFPISDIFQLILADTDLFPKSLLCGDYKEIILILVSF